MKYTEGIVVFDGWEIERKIGEGSYGTVFEIRKTEYNITAKSALKVITIPKSQTEVRNAYGEGMDEQSVTTYFKGFVDEIVKEISIMTQVKSHPNIVRFEDYKVVEHEDGIGWDVLIRMEYLTPFADYLYSKKMSEADVVRLGIEIADALDYCHKKGMVHRDVKPENLFVDENGSFKIGDFGVARTIDKTTGGMSKKGTEGYMAPEVYAGKEYDASVDTYSLGLVLYRILNGNRLPFLPLAPNPITYEDREKALVKRMRGDRLNEPTNVSWSLIEVVMKACEYEPQDRYKTASELSESLREIDLSIKSSLANRQVEYGTYSEENDERTVGIWDIALPNEKSQEKSQELIPQKEEMQPMVGTPVKVDVDNTDECEQITRESDRLAVKENKKKKFIVPIVVGGVILLAGALYAIIGHLIPYLNSNNTADEEISVEIDNKETYTGNEDNEILYKTALEFEEQNNYGEAAAIYSKLAGYNDSDERKEFCENARDYIEALSEVDQGNYDTAAKLFAKLDDFYDSEQCKQSAMYLQAEEEYSNKNYKAAESIFYNLKDYEDSENMYKKSVYAYVKECIEDKNYERALAELSNIVGYKDYDKLREKAMLGFVQKHKDSSNEKTLSYLEELIANGNLKAQKIYDELCKWQAKLVFVNNNPNDSTTIKKKVENYGYLQFGFELVQGKKGESIDIYHELTFPDGTTYIQDDWCWEDISVGEQFSMYWDDFYSNIKGKFYVRIYNKADDSLIGTASVMIK